MALIPAFVLIGLSWNTTTLYIGLLLYSFGELFFFFFFNYIPKQNWLNIVIHNVKMQSSINKTTEDTEVF